ncbi:DSBA oxidoreductase [Echinicola pacifica]|uniref:DSBA oxidoreductase n=1 Tax=Echinicola pacifica TaxID=346377 RepID=A0A918Q1U8_9BACT|nr:DsbA family oxidoreductase [Echinicola pacifica]GGZ30933.1 DSBA oxidoreductase [Echinicola pacifica]
MEKMKIEIWSDIMCPFCYIGKRRLEAALADFPHREAVDVEWKSFLLNPEMKTDPNQSIAEYLADTKGWTLEQAQEAGDHMAEMGRSEGLEYDFDKVVVANGRIAHRLLQYAKFTGKGDEMKERLFKAYFTEGANIADAETLIGLAKEVGLDEAAATASLDSKDYDNRVNQDIYESQQLGVRGVPFFVLDEKLGISGAQPRETFTQALNQAWEEFSKSKPGIQTITGADGAACDVDGNC